MANTFRIFVSSTFSDLHAERNALQKYVFPKLRELCLQNGCRFQAIDLRWGVSAEAGRDQQTMKICLEEIKRCQRVTPRPNFIVLLGDRYGWCPLPEEIPAKEFEQIIKNVNDDDKKVLLRDEDNPDGWYSRDDNAVPPSFCLQPRIDEYADYEVWGTVERKLHASLENAVVDFDEKTWAKYIASATEQEIIQGLTSEKANEHVFCFFRQIANKDDLFTDLPRQAKAKDFIELDENQSPNKTADKKLENLKNHLRQNLPKQNVHDYDAQWVANDSDSKTLITTDHIGTLPPDLEGCLKLLDDENASQNLCVDVWRQLARVIREEIANIKSDTAVQREKNAHEKFGEDRAKNFVGRASYLESIAQYVNANDQHPFALWGESGSGKSALMANAAEKIRKSNPNDKLIVRYIGATPQSSDIRALLESLCQEISVEYSADETTIPADYNELVKEFPKRLALATKEKRLVIMLDALDQLSEVDNAQNLRWLPGELPENVRLIVSTLPNDNFKILERKLPDENIIQLNPMPETEGGEVLDLCLKDAKRTLQDKQRAEILDKFTANGLPLYLKFAFEEARLWHSYDEIKPLSANVEGIIGDLFKRLSGEANHGAMMVSRALGYLAAARYGLTEDELIEVLWLDDEIKSDFKRRSPKSPKVDSLPVVVWSRLYFDLEPYLTERAGADTALLSFYHRQLGEVTAQKYLDGADKQRAHKHLSDYFNGQDYWHETPEQYRNRVGEFPQSARRANGRKATEFPFQIRQSGDYERLEQIHTNLDFLESKTAAGLVFELAKDFIEALKIIPSERPQRRIIRLLEEALRRDIHFIARHREDYPQALFQCLWNSGWWYDCPQAANHYEEKDGPWSRDGEKLYQLLEKWREQKETETPGFRWIRSLRPPPQHLGAGQIAILRGHQGIVRSVAISNDDHWILSCSDDRTIRIWDIETGKELRVLKGHDKLVRTVAVSPDGCRIVSCSNDESISVWDMGTGEELRVLKDNAGSLSCVVVSPDGLWIVSGSLENICIWDIETGAKLKEFISKNLLNVECVAVSNDGQRIISGRYDGTVRIWDIEAGAELKVLQGHELPVNSVAISSDDRRIVSGSYDKTIRVWNAETGLELKILRGHQNSVECVAISNDGRRIVSSSIDGTVRIWDIETGVELKVLRGPESPVTSIAISSDDRRIISGHYDGTVRIWDMEGEAELKILNGHKDWVRCVAITPDGRQFVSSSDDKTIRFWDMKTGVESRVITTNHPKRCFAITSDGRKIVSEFYEKIPDLQYGIVVVFDMETGALLKKMEGHEDQVSCLAISNDERRIVSSSDDGTVRIWDMETGVELKVLQHESPVNSVAISSDDRRIVSGSYDKTIRVWNAETGLELKILRGHQNSVECVAISNDGRRIVSRSNAWTVRIWDMETGEQLQIFEGMTDVQAIANRQIFSLRAVPQMFETSVENENQKLFAFFSDIIGNIKTYPDSRAWASGNRRHIYLIRLEDNKDYSQDTESEDPNHRIFSSWWKRLWTKKPEPPKGI